MMVNGMDFFNEALKKMPYLQAPSEPPSSTPEGHRIWEIAKQTAENNEELKDLLRKENGRHRDIGQSLIDGEDSTAGDAPDKA
ncbi:hypothetical protein DDK07_07720 [Mycobacteroides abscessus]|nr:hypothetical protein DDK07_07720 [Mycobacteroides abscessus]RIR80146.1 hypothetical protein D2E68_03900 [Mycobacteroides abscessus]RIT30010.1 hypothetical protein D2E73_00705 [Mycobacteroides abscessus]RIT38038.1 hypothetical protein D2E99_00705 [Mycobacteroides abscessus]